MFQNFIRQLDKIISRFLLVVFGLLFTGGALAVVYALLFDVGKTSYRLVFVFLLVILLSNVLAKVVLTFMRTYE